MHAPGERTDLTVVIPCFNEADNVANLRAELLPVIDELQRTRSVELIFVDDGSTDDTGSLLRQLAGERPETRVLTHATNRGLGAALRTGFTTARGDVVVSTDSDATYPFALIPKLLDCLQPGVAIATASCYHPAGAVDNVPRYRIVLSRGASFLYRVLVDWHIHTYTCMFRAYRREVLESVPFAADGFLSVTELLVEARLRGYRVAELPCTLHVRRHGASKARIARIIQSHLRFQRQVIARRWRSRLPHAQPGSMPIPPARADMTSDAAGRQ